mmetsp:Transcript_6727/g.20925  ORF Transcript_6727/g.20925 Transcript_6727/m.20925 type:complete len:206 (+) Transcript_6727:41-658(+)
MLKIKLVVALALSVLAAPALAFHSASSSSSSRTLTPPWKTSLAFQSVQTSQTPSCVFTRRSTDRRTVVLRAYRNEGPVQKFMSQLPLGTILGFTALLLFPSFVFGVFNAVFLIVVVLPAVLKVAFNTWARFNVLTAPCPVCGAPVQALKSSSEAMCFNCGAQLLSTSDGDGWRVRSQFDEIDTDSSSSQSVIDVESETIIDSSSS